MPLPKSLVPHPGRFLKDHPPEKIRLRPRHGGSRASHHIPRGQRIREGWPLDWWMEKEIRAGSHGNIGKIRCARALTSRPPAPKCHGNLMLAGTDKWWPKANSSWATQRLARLPTTGIAGGAHQRGFGRRAGRPQPSAVSISRHGLDPKT